MTPDEEDSSITHVDSDAEEGDEVEGEEAEEEEEVRDSKKRSREETDLEDGRVSSSNVTPEEQEVSKLLRFWKTRKDCRRLPHPPDPPVRAL